MGLCTHALLYMKGNTVMLWFENDSHCAAAFVSFMFVFQYITLYNVKKLKTKTFISKSLFFLCQKIDELKLIYAELERTYITSRNDTKQRMTDFIDNNAGTKLFQFNTELKQLRETISKKHPVSGITTGESHCLINE